jgi:hypothetical protein
MAVDGSPVSNEILPRADKEKDLEILTFVVLNLNRST